MAKSSTAIGGDLVMHTAPPRATPQALRTVFASELPKPDQPPELPFPPQKLTGREDSQIVDRLPEEVAEVSPIEREKDIGARERAEDTGLSLDAWKTIGQSNVSSSASTATCARSVTQERTASGGLSARLLRTSCRTHGETSRRQPCRAA